MDSRPIFTPELVCNNSGFVIGEEDRTSVSTGNQTSLRVLPSSFFIRTVMKISRSRCYCFLRRVFHYQNGLRSELRSNPLNSVVWMMTELIVLVVQISMIAYTLANSKKERPLWPMRIWVSGYGFGCVLSLLQLCWRYLVFVVPQGDASTALPDIEQQRRSLGESRYIEIMNKYGGLLELFFAIWFIIGNVWMFDSRFGSVHQAPKLRILCISLLSWNAISYSIPFYLFVLLCCIVPLLSNLVGYNMNMGCLDRGALDEQLSKLPSWSYKEVGSDTKNDNHDCCICLAKYREKEEIRQLPCSHIFHLKCVDQWLRIISCCPLCKQELHR